MLTFYVPDMTCGHCEMVITQAIKALDGNATLGFNSSAKTLAINSTANRHALQSAIEKSGYRVNKIENNNQASGHCCGCCSS